MSTVKVEQTVSATKVDFYRNFIVLGKTGVGKSTVANKILEVHDKKDPFEVSKDKVLSGVTKTLSSAMTMLEVSDGYCYVVQGVDTVGLFDNESNDDDIEKVKRFCIEQMTGLNLVIFVFRLGCWTGEEKNAFDILTKKFANHELSNICALVITGCDGMTESKREAIKKEFTENDDIKKFMKKGIYTVGFPNRSNLEPAVYEAYKTAQEKDQEILRNLVYSCNEKKFLTDNLKPEDLESSSWGGCVIL